MWSVSFPHTTWPHITGVDNVGIEYRLLRFGSDLRERVTGSWVYILVAGVFMARDLAEVVHQHKL